MEIGSRITLIEPYGVVINPDTNKPTNTSRYNMPKYDKIYTLREFMIHPVTGVLYLRLVEVRNKKGWHRLSTGKRIWMETCFTAKRFREVLPPLESEVYIKQKNSIFSIDLDTIKKEVVEYMEEIIKQ